MDGIGVGKRPWQDFDAKDKKRQRLQKKKPPTVRERQVPRKESVNGRTERVEEHGGHVGGKKDKLSHSS